MAKEKDLTFGKTRYPANYAKTIANRYKGFDLPSPKYYSGWFGFKFLQMLSKPFEEWQAYKDGLIDEKGNEQRKPIGSEKDIYNYWVKLVVRLKQLIDRQIDPGRRDLIYQRLFLIRESKENSLEDFFMELKNCENREINVLVEATFSGNMATSGQGLCKDKKKRMSFKDWLKKGKKSKKKIKDDTEPKEPIEDDQEIDLRGEE